MAFSALSFAQERTGIALTEKAKSSSEEVQIPVSNFRDLKEADAYAKALVTALQAEKHITGEFRTLSITHVGDRLPAELKWIIAHLDKMQIPVKFEWIRRQDLERYLDESRKEALNAMPAFLEYENIPKSELERQIEELTPRIFHAVDAAKLRIKYFFGMPYGLTKWTTSRSKGLKRTEAKIATTFVAASLFTTGFSIYLKQTQGLDPHVLAAVASVIGWSWLNAYEWRRIDELVASQSRYFREFAKFGQNFKGVFSGVETEYQMSSGRIWKFAGKGLMSAIGTTLVYGSTFGFDSVFTTEFLQKATIYSIVSAFARLPVEDWLNSKMPNVDKKDGSVSIDPTKGQWSMRKWLVANSIWVPMFWGVKNASLLGFGTTADILFYAAGGLGVVKTFWDDRFNIRNTWERLTSYFKNRQMRHCQNVLLGTEKPISLLTH